MEHVVTMLGNECNLYEFGNEPDNSGSVAGNIQGARKWIADVPQLRALNTNALFGGPALTWAGSDNGGTSYGSDMAYFLAQTAAAGVRADVITYHDYPCEKSTSTSACVSNVFNDFQYNYDLVMGWEKEYYGGYVPTGITEYNFDPGSNNLYSWGADDQFMYQWTQAAIDAIIQLRIAFANEYTALDYSGYGELNMFCDATSSNSDPACTEQGSPKGQYWGMVSEVEKYGGPSSLTIPNPLP